MYICLGIYVYIYMYICVYVYMCVCICVCMYICVYVYMCVCICIYIYVCVLSPERSHVINIWALCYLVIKRRLLHSVPFLDTTVHWAGPVCPFLKPT